MYILAAIISTLASFPQEARTTSPNHNKTMNMEVVLNYCFQNMSDIHTGKGYDLNHNVGTRVVAISRQSQLVTVNICLVNPQDMDPKNELKE